MDPKATTMAEVYKVTRGKAVTAGICITKAMNRPPAAWGGVAAARPWLIPGMDGEAIFFQLTGWIGHCSVL